MLASAADTEGFAESFRCELSANLNAFGTAVVLVILAARLAILVVLAENDRVARSAAAEASQLPFPLLVFALLVFAFLCGCEILLLFFHATPLSPLVRGVRDLEK